MENTEKKVFQIVPASSLAYVLLFAALLFVGFIAWNVVSDIAKTQERSAIFYVTIATFVLIEIVLLIFTVSVVYANCGGGRFIVDEKGLSIKGFLYGRTIPKEQLDVGAIMTFDMRKKGSCKPVWRTNGIGLPGYAEGWFRLTSKEKSLLFVTDKSKVVYLTTKAGYSALLSPSQPEDFIKAI